jgi:hypothetical protein
MRMHSSVVAGSASTLLLFITMSLLAAEPAGETGDLWEVTTKMSIEGMPMEMPARTSRNCSARVWTAPPSGGPGQCSDTEFRQDGNKVTWKTSCSGPPASTGIGEITRDGDSYTGLIRFTSAEGNMTIRLNGRRVGACTPK